MDTGQVDRDLSPRARAGLFASMVLLSASYVAAFVLFVTGSQDFIAKEIESRAQDYAAAHPLTLPATLELRSRSPHLGVLGSGWHPAEDDGVWAEGRQATLYLRLLSASPVELELDIDTFVGRVGGQAEVVVATQNGALGRWHVTRGASFVKARVRLSPEEPSPMKLLLQFSHPDSPLRLGVGPDSRTLGLKLIRIRAIADGPN